MSSEWTQNSALGNERDDRFLMTRHADGSATVEPNRWAGFSDEELNEIRGGMKGTLGIDLTDEIIDELVRRRSPSGADPPA